MGSPPTWPTSAASPASARSSLAALPIHPLALLKPRDRAGDRARAQRRRGLRTVVCRAGAVKMPRSMAGVRVTRIGKLGAGVTVSLVDAAGRRRPLKPGGWEHIVQCGGFRRFRLSSGLAYA